MHTKTDSDGTSLDNSWLPRSPRRPLYYVQSPSNHDAEKMSYGSSPTVSPAHLYYHSSPIHHSRESSASIFSNSLKIPRSLSAWKHIRIGDQDGAVHEGSEGDKDGDDWGSGARNVRLYFIGFLFFVLLFTVFCLILWGASKAYEPEISVKSMVFENFYVQAGNDQSGVPTDMLSLNSTVKIHYKNPATFFAVHVTSTPLEIHYFQLKLASGQVNSVVLASLQNLLYRLFRGRTSGSWKDCWKAIGHKSGVPVKDCKDSLSLFGDVVEPNDFSRMDLMKKFSQSRKSKRTVATVVHGSQVPLYGGLPLLSNARAHGNKVALPLNLTFVLRSRAYILGRLVKSKFHKRVRCTVALTGQKLGKPHRLTHACVYH
ncbi:hypothetical protein POTOM_017875 [Populus tomentosa]|uniref:Late embryogenesis abundant protein LEA-2 subgroup domain-containing protein n=1 Tax=Populus tomentosa TaxID=118781 RepID=A0A8X8ABJ4_POPTO|nr:hypothetical protein POTOM_017875 [Populus tomentosa]